MGDFLQTTPHHSNAVQDVFDHSSPHTRHTLATMDIPEASATSKRKVEQSASVDQTAPLEFSTSIDKTELQELNPTRI
ncbi:hypothetical protein V6N13_083226 [Hibiscus sabdariffa]